MGSDNGAVDHRVLVIGISGQMLKHPLPHPAPGPTAEPPVRVLPVAKAFRQVAPWDSGAASVEDRLDKPAIVLRSYADIFGFPGKQVLYPLPLIIAQSISGHGSALCEADSL